jgi:hypothetical protein
MKLNLTLFVIDGDYYLRQIQQVLALYPLRLNTQLFRFVQLIVGDDN